MKASLGKYAGLLVTYLKPQWRRVLVLSLLLGGSIALQLVNPQLIARALYWFRWGAMITFIFGVILLVMNYLYPGKLFWDPVTKANEAVGGRRRSSASQAPATSSTTEAAGPPT